MAAADLEEAIEDVSINVSNNASVANFDTWLEIFKSNVTPTLGRDSLDQRTVSNWFMPSLELRDRLKPVTDIPDTQLMITSVFRVLEAALAAQTANRITAAQAQMIVDQYNLAWP